jgi:lipopolysaccharide/colanic/teichoic acid biosynthesis glycosyltransferase
MFWLTLCKKWAQIRTEMPSCAVQIDTFAVPRCARHRAFVKDLVGRPLALAGLIVLSPLFLVIALLVRLSGPGPIIYRRRVVGQYGKLFDAFKFRTMVVDADAWLERSEELQARFSVNHKLPDDPRVTAIGRVLRRYSLDELPQLVNVVRGEMWLVGPRMIAPEELEKYGPLGPKLMSVKPGLTGLWQVSGRQTTSYAERVRLDMEYIDNWSVATDVRILLRTLGVVIRATGAY